MARRKQRDSNLDDDFREIEQMSKFIKQEKSKNLSFKIKSKFKNQKQKSMYDAILANRITFIQGSAGTGKTFIALMTALELLKNKKIGQIILTKPIVEVSKSIGFLKGTLEEKTSVYFNHFYDNVNKIIGYEQACYLKDNGFVVESVLNFMRGMTFDNLDENGKSLGAIVILDEAQNTNVHEMKTFISRMGEDCKLIIMGDVEQSDLKLSYVDKNGLKDAIDRFKDMNNIGYVEFTDDDIVRDPFLIEIMKRYRM
jgi:phosphate starvation-inducible PhoH-like protein